MRKNLNFKKTFFFLMSQGSLNPKIRFLGQKLCSVARERTDTHTDTHTDTKVAILGILSGLQEFSFNLSSRIGPKTTTTNYIPHN